MTLYGALETGGTKWVCAIGKGPGNVQAETSFATTTPEETIEKAVSFFSSCQAKLTALGIGSFGPLDLNPDSPTYGFVTSTPKSGWTYTDLAGELRRALGIPITLDTDVNAATFGEHCWGAAQGLRTFIYLTVGTGIGGGAMVNGKLLHGIMHPEMGHILIPYKDDDPFPGYCSYHGKCLEGLASGSAIRERWGQQGERLPSDHPAWSLEAHYLALGLVTYICTLMPQRIIMGGGVMQQAQLFPLIRQEVKRLLNDYVSVPEINDQIDNYILPSAFGNRAGVLGAMALAEHLSS